MADNDWISAMQRILSRASVPDTELRRPTSFGQGVQQKFSQNMRDIPVLGSFLEPPQHGKAPSEGVEAVPLMSPGDPISQIAMLLAPILSRSMTPAHVRSVPSGMQRLYRGETTLPPMTPPEWIAQDPVYQASQQASGRWWTDDPDVAQWYKNEASPAARTLWQDVPRDVAAQSHLPTQPPEVQRYSRDLQAEYFLPPEYVARGHVIPPELSQMSSPRRILSSQRGSTSTPSPELPEPGSLNEFKEMFLKRGGREDAPAGYGRSSASSGKEMVTDATKRSQEARAAERAHARHQPSSMLPSLPTKAMGDEEFWDTLYEHLQARESVGRKLSRQEERLQFMAGEAKRSLLGLSGEDYGAGEMQGLTDLPSRSEAEALLRQVREARGRPAGLDTSVPRPPKPPDTSGPYDPRDPLGPTVYDMEHMHDPE